MVVPSWRGTGDESDWWCAAAPVKSLLGCPLSVPSAGRCALLWPWLCCYLEQLPAMLWCSAIGNRELQMLRASAGPEEHISSFSMVLMSLKTQCSRRQKGCSANSLVFRKSVEIAWTLKPY